MRKYAVVLVLLVALIAVVPTFADDDILCSSFGIVLPIPVQQVPGSDLREVNWVPEGNYHNDIIVDCDCYISANAIVKGKVIEPDNTEDWSIFVDPQGTVIGGIEEKGEGSVFFNIGHDRRHHGNIEEVGPGDVWVWVDGMFSGTVEEMNKGWLRIEVFGGPTAGGPGTYTGIAKEMGDGDADLYIYESGGLSGKYMGTFKEEGPGDCTPHIDETAQQPRGNVCGT